MSTQPIYNAVQRVVKERLGARSGKIKYLDIGAGRGQLVEQLAAEMPVEAFACDFHTEMFRIESVPIAKVNLNEEPLPYESDSFDLVTCSEVIEHAENYRAILREAHRVLRKNGLLIVTTPNVLNVKSRFRYLVSGFANLFGPLPIKNDKLYSTGGHITPIPFFYLAHALLDANFHDVRLTIDKKQKTSLFLLPFSLPFITLGWKLFLSQEQNKHQNTKRGQQTLYIAAPLNGNSHRENHCCLGGEIGPPGSISKLHAFR